MSNIPKPAERNLFLTEQFDQKSIAELTKAIIHINESDNELEKIMEMYGQKYTRNPIKIYIDSYGGAVYQLMGLLGVMQESKTPIHTIAIGAAMSCGFVLLISGDQRFAYKHATPLYHQVSSWTVGKVQDIKEDLQETERLQKLIEDITLKRTKIKKEKLKEIREKKIDWFMTAEEALKLGVIDEIIS